MEAPILAVPDDVFLMILQPFSLYDLLQIETTCKRFRQVIRSNRGLWKDTLFVDQPWSKKGASESLSKEQLESRLVALRKQAEVVQWIDHVGINVFDWQGQQSLPDYACLRILPALHAKNVYISFAGTAIAKETVDCVDRILSQPSSSSLRSLIVRSEMVISLRDRPPESASEDKRPSYALASLTRLGLMKFPVTQLLVQQPRLCSIPSLKKLAIEVSYEEIRSSAALQRLLRSVEPTLEELLVVVDNVTFSTGAAIELPEIADESLSFTYPRLEKLCLRYTGFSSEPSEPLRIRCPRLRHLTLQNGHHLNYEDLLSETLETLNVEFAPQQGKAPEDREVWAKALAPIQHCQSLRSLCVNFYKGRAAHMLLESIVENVDIPLQYLYPQRADARMISLATQLVRSRQKTPRPIELVNVGKLSRNTLREDCCLDLDWLVGNTNFVNSSSGSPTFEGDQRTGHDASEFYHGRVHY